MTKRYHSTTRPVPTSDPLALDRTILANERTFLAYIRTAMTMLIGGITFISFFDQKLVIVIGWVAIFPALLLFWKGASHYYSLKKHLEKDHSEK